MDDEILQDFLLEAGEILEQLDSQLVDLESDPESRELLNAVFRGFHTIKGGAGFLGVDNLVAVSHKSEDIFDLLRNGKLRIDAQLMDVFLQVLDVLRRMFDELASGQQPQAAPAELLACLIAHAEGTAAPPADNSPAAPASDGDVAAGEAIEVGDLLDVTEGGSAESAPAPVADEDVMARIVGEMTGSELPAVAPPASAAEPADLITDDEFEALLDQRAAEQAAAAERVAATAPSDLITEDEFEALLDQREAEKSAASERATATPQGELITDDEFEAVLDRLHGPGRFASAAPASADGASGVDTAEAGSSTPAIPTVSAPAAADHTSSGDLTATALPASGGATTRGGEATRHAAPKQDTTVRVETETLDRIMNMVGELVLIRNRLTNLQSALGDEAVTQAVANLDVVTSDLQTAAMKTRMQPIKKVFGRFPRVVRDLARSLDKQIELVMNGEETDLDKNLVEALADPLVHLVRNSIDHGIEMPADRVAAGKRAAGTLTLAAEQAGDQIQLVIQDDGRGIDAEKLRAKAVASGLLDEDAARRLSARECFELIFLPGFSTKDQISDISGRGVGMDVVKTRITQLNGSITIESELGVGTTIRINVPLTLAIMPTLMVVLGHQVFALPLVNVQEIINIEAQQAREIDGRKTIVVRGRAIPLFYLSRWLVNEPGKSASGAGHVVVTRIGNQSVGLLVDELVGQEEVVIKPLGALLHGTKGLAGATITGNGKIALIIDLPGLLEAYARR